MKLQIRRIQLASLSKFGFLLGVVAAAAPSLLCGLSALGLVAVVRRWLEGWQDVTITILGRDIAQLDFVSLLGLSEFVARLQAITGASFFVMALAVLALALVSGVLLGAIVLIVGLVYNVLAAATGGLVVDADTFGDGSKTE